MVTMVTCSATSDRSTTTWSEWEQQSTFYLSLPVWRQMDSLVSQLRTDVFVCQDYKLSTGISVCREKPKVTKAAGDSSDGPEAKKAKVDPNETIMVKKVG